MASGPPELALTIRLVPSVKSKGIRIGAGCRNDRRTIRRFWFKMDLGRGCDLSRKMIMTLSSIQSLPDQDLEAKIAHQLGWTKLRIVRRVNIHGDNGVGQLQGVPPDGHGEILFTVPFYCRSRDAAADIEREIANRGLQHEYITTLRKIVQTPFMLWGLVTAAPRQRLEAAYFVLTGQRPG
jgi:hypothetical protein